MLTNAAVMRRQDAITNEGLIECWVAPMSQPRRGETREGNQLGNEAKKVM